TYNSNILRVNNHLEITNTGGTGTGRSYVAKPIGNNISATTFYILLCVFGTGGNNEVIGNVYGHRSSGAFGIRNINFGYSSTEASSVYRAYMNYDVSDYANETWRMVSLDYSGTTYLALEYDATTTFWYSDVFFTGFIKSTDYTNVFLQLDESSVTNVNEIQYLSRSVYRNYVGINESIPQSPLHVVGPDGDGEGTPTLNADTVAIFQNNNSSSD